MYLSEDSCVLQYSHCFLWQVVEGGESGEGKGKRWAKSAPPQKKGALKNSLCWELGQSGRLWQFFCRLCSLVAVLLWGTYTNNYGQFFFFLMILLVSSFVLELSIRDCERMIFLNVNFALNISVQCRDCTMMSIQISWILRPQITVQPFPFPLPTSRFILQSLYALCEPRQVERQSLSLGALSIVGRLTPDRSVMC